MRRDVAEMVSPLKIFGACAVSSLLLAAPAFSLPERVHAFASGLENSGPLVFQWDSTNARYVASRLDSSWYLVPQPGGVVEWQEDDGQTVSTLDSVDVADGSFVGRSVAAAPVLVVFTDETFSIGGLVERHRLWLWLGATLGVVLFIAGGALTFVLGRPYRVASSILRS